MANRKLHVQIKARPQQDLNFFNTARRAFLLRGCGLEPLSNFVLYDHSKQLSIEPSEDW